MNKKSLVMMSFLFRRVNLLQKFSPSIMMRGKNSSTSPTVGGKGTIISPTGSLDLGMNRIVWIDMEMTGLNIDEDKIMEIACLVTDSDLNVVAEGPDIIINQHESILDNMDEWCIKQHGKTGLSEACLKSTISLKEAESSVLDFLSTYVSEKECPLAGNSVYMDRLFLLKHMPKVHDFIHYRIIDVSTIKEICRRWNPKIFNAIPKKEYSHRALQDIRESVEELRYYKEHFFKLS